MSIPKKKLLMNSFFTSKFNYCPHTWMCQNRTMNNKISRLQERCLRIVYSDKTSSFEKLLEKDGSAAMHTKNLQTLVTEMFKIYKNLSPAIITDLFHVRQNDYNLRRDSNFALTWFSSGAFTAYFLSVFSIGISIGMFLYIFFSCMYTQIFFFFFISYIFKCQRALTLDLGYRKPPRCVGAISQI